LNAAYFPTACCKWLLTLTLLTLPAIAAQPQGVIIHSTGSREALKQQVQAMGGTIRYEFMNFNAVSAVMPSKSAHALAAVPGMKVNKSLPVRGPSSGHSGIAFKAPARVRVSGNSSWIAKAS